LDIEHLSALTPAAGRDSAPAWPTRRPGWHRGSARLLRQLDAPSQFLRGPFCKLLVPPLLSHPSSPRMYAHGGCLSAWGGTKVVGVPPDASGALRWQAGDGVVAYWKFIHERDPILVYSTVLGFSGTQLPPCRQAVKRLRLRTQTELVPMIPPAKTPPGMSGRCLAGSVPPLRRSIPLGRRSIPLPEGFVSPRETSGLSSGFPLRQPHARWPEAHPSSVSVYSGSPIW
jgi:hypothetical protein